MQTFDLKILYKQIVGPSPQKIKFKSICSDHRELKEGDLFIAIKGHAFDGHKFLKDVILKKPAWIILEKPIDKFINKDMGRGTGKGARVDSGLGTAGGGGSGSCARTGKVTDMDLGADTRVRAVKGTQESEYKNIIVVRNSKIVLDQIAYHCNGEPSKNLFVVAVTGTSGKTTTSHMVEHILNKLDIPTGVIGTNNHHFRSKVWATKNTTPGSLELYARIKEFKNLGAKGLSIEASSHALEQHRMDSLKVDVAVFTNFSRDHLDYHKTLAKYFAAKNKLFKKNIKFAVVNGDDIVSKKIKISPKVKKIFYGKYNNKSNHLKYKIIHQDFTSITVEVLLCLKSAVKSKTDSETKQILRLPVPGEFNISNALAAIGAGLAAATGLSIRAGRATDVGLPTRAGFSQVVQALSDFKGVRGRLEQVPNTKNRHIFVDYAHKPDALKKVLECLNNIRKNSKSNSQIITVFGCGGDRDPGKRPLMAKIAADFSDFIIVTSDNPRNEDPEKIIQDIYKGFKKSDLKKTCKIVDRKNSIKKAIEISKPEDVILIAGKGHEAYQIVGSETFDFDDTSVVQELLPAIIGAE